MTDPKTHVDAGEEPRASSGTCPEERRPDPPPDGGLDTLVQVGHLETPYETPEACPSNIDPEGPLCRVVVAPRFRPALEGLEAGEEVLLLYWLGGADRSRIRQEGRRRPGISGTFALRSPHRPNPIGAAVVPIEALDGDGLVVRGLDAVNGTPLLDIKPAARRERTAGRSGR